ncbi:MAG: rhomboid family intramembrane serine protease [Chitinivibrionales bacterium]|nr:rhomboid family intramembrane serine protease [Chitinivibrionales bacterium]
MLPLRCDNVEIKFPLFTLVVIVLCATAFVRTDLLHDFAEGFIPVNFAYALFHPEHLGDALLVLVASFFLHGGVLHITANMWYLWIFGSAVESTVGSFRFAVLYTAAGIVSMLVQGVGDPLSKVPVVGASGAIAGIMGMHFMLLPRSRIVVWIPPIFFIPVPAFIFLIVWFGMQYLNFRNSEAGETSIAWLAHIGGYVFGTCTGFVLRLIPQAHKTHKREQR